MDGDGYDQRDEKQRHPDKLVVAEQQYYQQYTGDGYVERGIGYIKPEDVVKKQEEKDEYGVNALARTAHIN